NAAGERDADFINCVAWRKLAEQVGQYCTRGRLIAVEGRLQVRSYETQDGARRRGTEVIGDRVWVLDSPGTETDEAAEQATGAQPDWIEDPEVAVVAEDA